MSADSPSPTPGPPEPPVAAAAPVRSRSAPADFAAIARKISSRTTDLIAISVVLVGSLVFGRQITEWWRADPSDARLLSEPAASTAAWGSDGLPVFLEFGNSGMSLTRQSVAGDREAADQALVSLCRRGLEHSPLPTRAPDAAESRFLAKLADLAPVAEEPGVWRLFQVREGMPLAAGVRRVDSARNESGQLTEQPEWRLICFGLAVPAGDKAWNLYGFQPAGATAQMARQLPVPLPEGARQIMAVRDERGGSLVAFQGRSAPESWKEFFNAWAASQGVSSKHVWTESAAGQTARFELDRDAKKLIVEVHLAIDAGGNVTGLLNVVPNE